MAQRLTKKAKGLGSIYTRRNELFSLPPSNKTKDGIEFCNLTRNVSNIEKIVELVAMAKMLT